MEKQGLPVDHLYHMLHSRTYLAVFLSSPPCPAPGFISSCAGFFLLQLQNFDNVLLSDAKLPWQFSLTFFFHINIYHHFFFSFKHPQDPEWTHSALICELGEDEHGWNLALKQSAG